MLVEASIGPIIRLFHVYHVMLTVFSRAALVDTVMKAQELLTEHAEWPPVTALLRFGYPLRRLKNHKAVAEKWVSNFYVMRHGCLYHSNGKNGFAGSSDGTFECVRRSFPVVFFVTI